MHVNDVAASFWLTTNDKHYLLPPFWYTKVDMLSLFGCRRVKVLIHNYYIAFHLCETKL
jgi:hypothetical protein